MNFEQTPEFQKDVKRLSKKWRTLPTDIEAVQRYISPLYERLAIDVDVDEYRREFFVGRKAAILHAHDDVEIIKMRLDVEALGSNKKVRIIFVAVKTAKTITFIELYAKNDKENPDSKRIARYL